MRFVKIMQIAILIAPNFDEPTSYTFNWSRELVSLLQEKGYNVIDIGNKEVSRSEVEYYLNLFPNVLCIHYNHLSILFMRFEDGYVVGLIFAGTIFQFSL